MNRISIWKFAMGESSGCLENARTVNVPHTWATDNSVQGVQGIGWYKTRLEVEQSEGQRTFLHFNGAYRDTRVWVNGNLAGEHYNAGYLPFEVEITPYLEDAGADIIVSVDNRASETAVPYGKSFDWPDDGGLIRPVQYYQTGTVRIEHVSVDGEPVFEDNGERVSASNAILNMHLRLNGACSNTIFRWMLREEHSRKTIRYEETSVSDLEFDISRELQEQIQLWHFDKPVLYSLKLCLLHNGHLSDQKTVLFGFRRIRINGAKWMINGESVRLPGMEWMPGSNPHMGMAASALFNKHMLKVLRESNSVMTRFHWQQDESVLNYCDRHGILIQEEIPLWGAAPEDSKKQAELWPVIRQQIEDMITAHCNHPCIFAWGIGNELQADNEDVQMLIRKAVSYVHELDPKRQANYVSNTAWTSPETDGTSIGDCMMVNDYIGTWHKGVTQEGAWQKLMESHLDRAMISSEFGLCEPVFSGGDEERNRIFLQKIAFYRRYPQIVGAISFSLNDYRTHMGEAVDGKERVRVHGSTDLCGNKKPSYYTIQKEYCPLIVRLKENRLMLICRRDIPSYTVHGYYIRKSNRGSRIQIPDLKPGDSWIYLYRGLKESLSIHRPDGTPVFRG